MQYSMECSCGHVMEVEGTSREDAASNLKAVMTQDAIDQHWAEMHQADDAAKPTLEQVHAMIDQMVAPVAV